MGMLCGGPRNEIRRFETKQLIAELVHIYQVKDKTAVSAIQAILKPDERPTMANGYLCKFLFDNNHKRWQEYLSVLNSYVHLAVPLLKAIMRCNSTNDIMAHWSGLLQIIQNRTVMGVREIAMSLLRE